MTAVVGQAVAAWREADQTNAECDEQISQLTQTNAQLHKRYAVERRRAVDQATMAAYLERMAVAIRSSEDELSKHPEGRWSQWSRYFWGSSQENDPGRKWREQQVQRASLRVFVERDSLGGEAMVQALRTASRTPYPVSLDRLPDRWEAGRLKHEVLVARERVMQILQLGKADFLRMKKELLEQEMAIVQEKLEGLRAALPAEVELRMVAAPSRGVSARLSPVEAARDLDPRVTNALIRETLSQHIVMEQTAQAKQRQILALQQEQRHLEIQNEKWRSQVEERIQAATRLEQLREELQAAEKIFLEEQQRSVWGYIMRPYGIDPGCPTITPAAAQEKPAWQRICDLRRTIVQTRNKLTELVRNRPVGDQKGDEYQMAPQTCLQDTWQRTCMTKSVNGYLEAVESHFWNRKMKELRAELGLVPIIEAVKKVGGHDLNIDDSCRDYIVQHESATDAILQQWIEALSADLLSHNVQDGSTLTLSCRETEEGCAASLQIRQRGE